jgi:hemoglobin/transferrin/lactoferrin receptor protein
MKKFLGVWLLSFVFQYAQAQIVTLIDEESSAALELATLVSETPKAFATTDAQGQANIAAFKSSMAIEIRSIGYETKVMSYAEMEKQGFQITLLHFGLTLDYAVISASRWNQSVQKVPAKVTTIHQDAVALQNPQTAADLLASSGEVFVQKSQQGGGSPMIRGFSTNRLLIAVDGVRMNTAIFRSGNLQNVISIDPFATEQTEVLFGPGSVLYGSDAVGGVMSFYTLEPQLSLTDTRMVKGKAVIRYSSANAEQTGHFDVNVGGRKWASMTSISHFKYGDLRMGTHGPDEYLRPFYVQRQDSVDVVVKNDDPLVQRPTAYSQLNMMQKVRYKPTENWDLTHAFHYSTTTDYARYDRHIRLKDGLPRSGEWSYGPQEWAMNQLSISHFKTSLLADQFTLRLAHQYFEESRMDRDFNKTSRAVRVEQVNAYSFNADFIKALNDKHHLNYGLESVYNDVHSEGRDEDVGTAAVQVGPSRYPESNWASHAIYLTHHWDMTDKLGMHTGVRFNQYVLNATFDTSFYVFPFTNAEVNNSAVTGSLGFNYRPTQKWSFNANVSTGFRAPNVDDMGKVFDSEPGAVVVPNPQLKAEYVYNAEVGIAKVFAEVLKVDATAYYTLLEDAMVRRDYTLNGRDSIEYDGTLSQVQAIQNASSATVYGIQAGFEAKLPARFSWSARYNYQKGEEELDDGTTSASRHAAPWFGVSHLTYTEKKVKLDVYVMLSGERKFKDMPEEERGKDYLYALDGDGNPYAPGWYTLNFKSTVKLTEQLMVSAGLENITDQRYRPYSSGISAAGRNAILSLKATF